MFAGAQRHWSALYTDRASILETFQKKISPKFFLDFRKHFLRFPRFLTTGNCFKFFPEIFLRKS